MTDTTRRVVAAIWRALDAPAAWLERLQVTGKGDLPSVFAVTDLAAASAGVAGLAVAELMAAAGGPEPAVSVDRRLASFWFGRSIRPQGWDMSPPWDSVAGDYQTEDGWIRLHTNAPHHRAAALAVLDLAEDQAARDRALVAHAVSLWGADALESAIVGRGGCAAAMRSLTAWAAHPQGRAVTAEPLIIREPGARGRAPRWHAAAGRPLQGVRVLDMTRVLAGPVATRFLAGFGADVLRIDPPDWDEPGVVPDVVLGKACARLDLRRTADRGRWERLLAGADVLIHGYRPGALAALGLDAGRRRALCPGLVDVSLDAYGWSGPWAARRGFDSLLQMSSGIAEAGMRQLGRDRPTPLPVQALDHATGYIMAAAALRGLTGRLSSGARVTARASLARTAGLLTGMPVGPIEPIGPETADDLMDGVEQTAWGPARRIQPPIRVAGAPMRWDRPAAALGSAPAAWAA